MGLGVGIFLIAVGAILAFAVNATALLVLGLFAQPLLHWCQAAFPV